MLFISYFYSYWFAIIGIILYVSREYKILNINKTDKKYTNIIKNIYNIYKGKYYLSDKFLFIYTLSNHLEKI